MTMKKAFKELREREERQLTEIALDLGWEVTKRTLGPKIAERLPKETFAEAFVGTLQFKKFKDAISSLANAIVSRATDDEQWQRLMK